VKFVLDENLSPRLIARLTELFGEINHVRNVGLQRADDRAIWDWAQRTDHIVITTDGDFVALSRRLGSPPKVIHLVRCNFPFHVIEDLLRKNAIRIAAFANDPEAALLILRHAE
jgi:predicted nuclease of predicted toxin-antitoxin system